MSQITEKRIKRVLRRLCRVLEKHTAELGLALNAFEVENDDCRKCDNKLYKDSVRVWFNAKETLDWIDECGQVESDAEPRRDPKA